MNWLRIRKRVIKRDRYQCQRCKRFYLEDNLLLTVHHIVPRSEGGGNKLSNLITLCFTCHDHVELEGFEPDNSRPTATRKDWRKWVYGGYRKP